METLTALVVVALAIGLVALAVTRVIDRDGMGRQPDDPEYDSRRPRP